MIDSYKIYQQNTLTNVLKFKGTAADLYHFLGTNAIDIYYGMNSLKYGLNGYSTTNNFIYNLRDIIRIKLPVLVHKYYNMLVGVPDTTLIYDETEITWSDIDANTDYGNLTVSVRFDDDSELTKIFYIVRHKVNDE